MANLERHLTLWRTLRAASEGMSLLELSRRLGVSKLTVQRDVDQLSSAGIPVAEEQRGQQLRYRVVENSAPALTVLTPKEARALDAAKAALSPLRRSKLFKDYEAALSKLQTSAASNAFSTSGPEALVVPKPEVIDAFVEAVLANRRCRISYTPRWSKEPRSYVVEPAALSFHEGMTYVRARIPPYRNLVPYPMHRIDAVELLAETFKAVTVPRNAFGVFEGKPMRVVARFHPDIASYIAERRWHPSQKLTVEADGWLRFEARLSGMWEFVGWVMSWGDNAELVEPREWRNEVKRRAEKMVERHG